MSGERMGAATSAQPIDIASIAMTTDSAERERRAYFAHRNSVEILRIDAVLNELSSNTKTIDLILLGKVQRLVSLFCLTPVSLSQRLADLAQAADD